MQPETVFGSEVFAGLHDLVTKLADPNTTGEVLSNELADLDVIAQNLITERAELGARATGWNLSTIACKNMRSLPRRSCPITKTSTSKKSSWSSSHTRRCTGPHYRPAPASSNRRSSTSSGKR